jgi:hypothetical protein
MPLEGECAERFTTLDFTAKITTHNRTKTMSTGDRISYICRTGERVYGRIIKIAGDLAMVRMNLWGSQMTSWIQIGKLTLEEETFL